MGDGELDDIRTVRLSFKHYLGSFSYRSTSISVRILDRGDVTSHQSPVTCHQKPEARRQTK